CTPGEVKSAKKKLLGTLNNCFFPYSKGKKQLWLHQTLTIRGSLFLLVFARNGSIKKIVFQ
ncbi:MAG TPA: hypothetical protein PKK43_07300, partial [Spirochaetota bacterium]|nr:hypothetical protein [Spirochaetota bacterium]